MNNHIQISDAAKEKAADNLEPAGAARKSSAGPAFGRRNGAPEPLKRLLHAASGRLAGAVDPA